MSVNGLTSSSVVIAQVYRDFNPSHSGWIGDAIEWIGRGLEEIGVIHLIPVSEEKTVANYRTALPCGEECIRSVFYSGYRLPKIKETRRGRNLKYSTIENQVDYHWYDTNPGYIRTSFKEGTIEINYDTVPTDKDGFPLLPDDHDYKEALSWYVLMKMMSRGYKHHTFDYSYAREQWDMYSQRASNNIVHRNEDDMEHSMRVWLSLVSQNRDLYINYNLLDYELPDTETELNA